MDFWDLTKVVLRRWYVALPLMMMTAAASAWVALYVEPDYKATAYVSLIPPQPPADPEERLRNPYLDLGLAALTQSAATVTRDASFLESLVDRGLTDNIAIEQGYPAPIATIEAIGSSKAQALATLNAVVTRYNEAVLALQRDANAAENSLIMPQRLDQGDNLEETGGKVKRAFIAVMGAGALVTAGVTVGIDALLRRRRRRAPDLDGLLAGPAPLSPPPSGVVSAPVGVSAVRGLGGAATPSSLFREQSPGAVEPPTADIRHEPSPDSTIVLPKYPDGQAGRGVPASGKPSPAGSAPSGKRGKGK